MDDGREFQVGINAWGKERRMVLFDRGGRVNSVLAEVKVVSAGYLRLLPCTRMSCVMCLSGQ